MPKAKPGNGPFNQILVAVVIALLVGGSAPWWWNEVKTWRAGPGPQPGPGKPLAESSGPETATRALLQAWNQGDRSGALKVAEPDAVDRLFGATSLQVNSKDITCYPTGDAQRDCHMPHSRGVLVFRILQTDRGWRVNRVEY
jgi:hypothetical protein